MKTAELDLKRAFIPATPDLHERIEEAFERGELVMRRRRRMNRMLSAAAVLALIFVTAGFVLRDMQAPKPDNVVLSTGKTAIALQPTRVPESAAQQEAEAEEFNPDAPDDGPDFMHVDPKDEDALQRILDMAYRDYCARNGLEFDGEWVDTYALNMLLSIPGEYGEDTSKWIEPVRNVLKGYLGLDLVYIAENSLTNYVIACLSVREWELNTELEPAGAELQEAELREEAEFVWTDAARQMWNDGLENYLTEIYARFCAEHGGDMSSGVLYRTAGELMDIPEKYGMDAQQWSIPISDCLQGEMGLDAAFIQEWDVIEGICACLSTENASGEVVYSVERDLELPVYVQSEGAKHKLVG